MTSEKKKGSGTGCKKAVVAKILDNFDNMPKLWRGKDASIDSYTPELVKELYQNGLLIYTGVRNQRGCNCIVCKKKIRKKGRAVSFYDFRIMPIDRRRKNMCMKCFVKLTDREVPEE